MYRRVNDRLQRSLNHETNLAETTTSDKLVQHQRGQKRTVNCSAGAESREAKEKELGESSAAILEDTVLSSNHWYYHLLLIHVLDRSEV